MSAGLSAAWCALREALCAAFWTAPERLALLVLRRDRIDLSAQIGGIPGVRRNPLAAGSWSAWPWP